MLVAGLLSGNGHHWGHQFFEMKSRLTRAQQIVLPAPLRNLFRFTSPRPGNRTNITARGPPPEAAASCEARVINTLMLWMASQEQGYVSRHWMTFRQAEEMKAHVRKGEHGTMAVYADRMTRIEHDGIRRGRRVYCVPCFSKCMWPGHTASYLGQSPRLNA